MLPAVMLALLAVAGCAAPAPIRLRPPDPHVYGVHRGAAPAQAAAARAKPAAPPCNCVLPDETGLTTAEQQQIFEQFEKSHSRTATK